MIANICVGFHLGTLHGYFFHQDFWPNLNFLLEDQIKLVLSFCLGYFDKINLSKPEIIFSNLSCYAKTGLKKDNFQILDSKKTNTCFKRPMKELKTVF